MGENLSLLKTCGRSDRLPSLYVYTPLSLVTDPLCYIDLTFIEIPFAKLNYINLLGTFVRLEFGRQTRFNLKINRWRHDLSNGTAHAWLILIETFKTTHEKGIKCALFGSRLHGNVRWGTFLITIERVTFYIDSHDYPNKYLYVILRQSVSPSPDNNPCIYAA